MEKCVGKEILFDYCNNSLDNNKMNLISTHLNSCVECNVEIEKIKDNISTVLNSFNSITPKNVTIPNFSLQQNKTKILDRYKVKKTLSWAAGISLLITISTLASVKISHNLKPVNDYEYLDYIPDMNDAWQNNSIVVTQYDNKGNPVKHQIIKPSN